MNAIRGLAVTSAGRNLFAKLAATQKALTFTRVMFGTGKMPEGSTDQDMMDRTALVEPLAEGTSTTPIYENDTVSMVLQFRSDMNGGLEQTVWLNEYGVYATDFSGNEVLILYGNLGDYPDSVLAYQQGVVTTRDYPISIVIGAVSEVNLDFIASAFLTSENANQLMESCLRRAVSFSSVNVSIPISAWRESEENYFAYVADVLNSAVSSEHCPDMILSNECISVARACGLSPSVLANDGALRFYAQELPSASITGVCRLLKKGMEHSNDDGTDQPTSGTSCKHWVISSRARQPGKPLYGLGGGGEDGSVALEVSPYTGTAEVTAIINGVPYDADNLSFRTENIPNGTMVLRWVDE